MHRDNLPKFNLWKIAERRDNLVELCEITICTEIARAVVVISYSDGDASIRYYCPKHEGRGVAALKRTLVGVELIDHRGQTPDRRRYGS